MNVRRVRFVYEIEYLAKPNEDLHLIDGAFGEILMEQAGVVDVAGGVRSIIEDVIEDRDYEDSL